MCGGDRPGGCFAITAAPRPPQPIRRVESRSVLRRDAIGAFDAQPSQHGVDQPLVREKTPAVSKVDAGRYRRVRWRSEEQELSGAKPQYVVDCGGARRQRSAETQRDQRIDLAEPPQCGSDEQACKCPVSP